MIDNTRRDFLKKTGLPGMAAFTFPQIVSSLEHDETPQQYNEKKPADCPQSCVSIQCIIYKSSATVYRCLPVTSLSPASGLPKSGNHCNF
jgi:hypothetical protein